MRQFDASACALRAAAVVASAAPVLPPLHPIFRAGEGAPLPTPQPVGNFELGGHAYLRGDEIELTDVENSQPGTAFLPLSGEQVATILGVVAVLTGERVVRKVRTS